ncbi:MAG: histidine kinase dimerization/phospho-acceptor domain-containing protein [Patescibacteria group bacterium]
MDIIPKLELVLLICAVCVNILLAWAVFFSDKKSATNKIYTLLSLTISIWLATNFISHNLTIFGTNIYWMRLSLFFALPMSTLFFLFAHTLPNAKIQLSKQQLFWLLTTTITGMIITISPYTFISLKIIDNSPQPIPGPGIFVFALLSTIYSIQAIIFLFKKFSLSTGVQRRQFKYIMSGVILMLSLIILTIFIPFIAFKNSSLLGLLPLYTLIFLSLTAYVIVSLHLFNVKVIVTEALFLSIWVALLSSALTEKTPSDKLIGFILLFGITFLGSFLIKSVKKEVKQRELLEIITKQLEGANEKLKSLDQARAEFITIASHQLRTPPATIKWYLSSVLDGDYGQLKPEQKEILEKTNRTNNSLISLIDDMLNVSRIERGKMEFLFEQTSLLDLAKITFEQLEPIAKEKGLKLTFKTVPKTKFPKLMADKEKIRQVMNNLIDNSLKYTKQ